MTFLTPTTGIAVGAIGAAVLLSLYLLKLRRRPLRISSTLLWEQAVQDLQVNTPLRWLRASLLLFIQLAALAALALAAARPMLGGAGDEVSSRIVILIDCSASMSARDGRAASNAAPRITRLTQAKEEARAIVSCLDRGGGSTDGPPRAMIVALAAQATPLTSFTASTSDLLDAIDSIQPTDQPTNIESASSFIRAQGAGDQEGQSPSQRPTVYFISDGNYASSGTASEGPGLRGLDVRAVPCGPLPSASASPDNLGIVAIDARTDPDDPSLIRVFVRVQNAGESEVSTVLRCAVDGATRQSVPIIVAGASAGTGSEGQLILGEASTTFELSNLWPGRAPGAATQRVVTASIDRADLLAADDAAAVVLRPPQARRVLIVAPERKPDPFVLGAIEAASGATEHSDTSSTPGSVIHIIDEQTYATQAAAQREPMSAWDVVVFDRVEPSVLPAAPSMSLGAGLPSLGIKVAPPPGTSAGDFARVATWQRFHPILRYVALDTVVIAPPMSITSLPDTAVSNSASQPATPNPAQTPLLSFDSLADGTSTSTTSPNGGSLIALARDPRGLPRLVVAFDIAHSTWGPDVSFPIFIINALETLSSDARFTSANASAPIAHTTREVISLPLPGGITRVRVAGPVSLSAEAIPSDTSATAQLGVLPRAGVYTATPEPAAAELPPLMIAVNLVDSVESSLAAASDLTRGANPSGSDSSADRAAESSQPREIWHWCVAVAGLLLTLEWLLYAWRMRS